MSVTEEPTAPTTVAPAPPRPTYQETWAQNEKMRHVPTIGWMIHKLDSDLRRRIEKLLPAYADLPHDDPRRPPLEQELRGLCRALDRLADVARRPRGPAHPPADLVNRISWAISHTIQNLNAADVDTFGRRYPFQTFERSNAEPLWAAMLSVIEHVHRLIPMVRPIDPDIDEKMYEGLVTLAQPLPTQPMA